MYLLSGSVSMKEKPKKTYDANFKREAVRIANAGDVTDRQVERDLGL